jgi:hypothetical protein
MTAIIEPKIASTDIEVHVQVPARLHYTSTLNYLPPVTVSLDDDSGEAVVAEALKDLEEGRFARHLSADDFVSSVRPPQE